MAWIETYNGAVNLDTVQVLAVAPVGSEDDVSLTASFEKKFRVVFTTDRKYRNKLIKVTHQIAQIARGNAYISQDDIRRMMDEQE